MAKIDFEKFVTSLLCGDPQCNWNIGTVDIRNALKEQGLEYKDGKIVEIKQEPSIGEYGDMRIPKDLEDRFNGINEKLCELQDKLGDIYAIVSKLNMNVPIPQYPQHIFKPGNIKCDTSNAHSF